MKRNGKKMSRTSNIESDNSQTSGLDDYNYISKGTSMYYVIKIWGFLTPYPLCDYVIHGCSLKNEYMIASKILWQRRLKIIVVSTWKSGSTLLSDLLASMPNSFVMYEPLHHFGIHRLISTTDKIYNEVISLLISLLDCDFSMFKSE